MTNDEKRWEFFGRTECERCGGDLKVRTMSWFTLETICGSCMEKERTIRHRMYELGINPDDYEGCGTVPELGKLEKLKKK